MNAIIRINIGPKELLVSRYRDSCVRFEIGEKYSHEEYVEMTGEEPESTDELNHNEVILIDDKSDLRMLIAYLSECLGEKFL